MHEMVEEPSRLVVTQGKHNQHPAQGAGRTDFLVRLQPEGETKGKLVPLAGGSLLAKDKSHLSLWLP